VGVVIPLDEGKNNAASVKPLQTLTKADMERVNQLILSQGRFRCQMIPEVANHLISSGGKRLRPMLTLAAGQHVRLCAATTMSSSPPAVEFMHTATLLHDDVVDESDMRRGSSTARMHLGQPGERAGRRFPARPGLQDDGRGRLAGGARRPLDRRGRHRRGRGDCSSAAKNMETTEDDYLAVIRAKTAALFAAACRSRAHRSPARRQGRTQRLKSYGHESRPRLPARRRRARLWRQGRRSRQECRRRFPRGQDHAAGRPVLSAAARRTSAPSGAAPSRMAGTTTRRCNERSA
jgi:octaprenyl-diphosphate synthase